MFPLWHFVVLVMNFEKLDGFFPFFSKQQVYFQIRWTESQLLCWIYFCQALSVLHTLLLKSLRLAIFLRSFWTQCTSDFLSRIFKTIKRKKRVERLKNIRIGKLRHVIFSNPLAVISSETKREKLIFKIKIRITW